MIYCVYTALLEECYVLG